ncbi:error-prone DNA polymerase [Mucilaginibacter lappiensis]|uniref:Error-prone DNA polymerase n=1 Tax=Mucilaginibacter lappiensis TaxID=354630 RepID=A0ABR6PFK7_9SPHI|nr:error-prone DNA polymerase [Mucilaginibacter lappiensis]MBB6107805.1 error-prone DNA polymerase [Mucilaginibacter lappiensis]SIP96604.1 error-prone DNA polymerase [Mucilaginibacter lappiensis]
MDYAELQVTSNFSFLRGGSHPHELVEHAAALGYSAIAITDRNSLAGIVRAHMAAKTTNIRFIPACRLDLMDGVSLLAYPTDIVAYSRLSALLTKGNLRTEKGKCELYKADVYEYMEGILFVAVPPDQLNSRFELDATFLKDLTEYREHFGRSLYLAASFNYQGQDAKRLFRLEETGVPLVATGDVHYHHATRRELQDILTCIREKCTIHTAGFKLHPNAERFLKERQEIFRLFRGYPQALKNSSFIAHACHFSLDELKYLEPEEQLINGLTSHQQLTKLTWEGAKVCFGQEIPEKHRKQIEFELDFIQKRRLAWYFLRVYHYTQKAEELGILHQGRGSAANSTVCFCLGITAVNPAKSRLLFSRFMSEARDEWPDIDVDFEHERREEIIQFIYSDYGRDRAAIVATVTQERHKGAIRDVGKAMGLSEDTIKRIGGTIWDFREEGFDEKRLSDQGLNPKDPLILKVLQLTCELIGFPRQLGQHTGGFVITEGKLSDLCPVLNARMEERTQLEWNKDDLEDLKILKVDVLGLGMLTMIRKAFDLVLKHYGRRLTLANVPQDDPLVYDMICRADTIGVFQIESRAQMSMLPRLKPREFYDLVIEVAIVRPGPIQGDMVHPYLRRRNGEELPEYPKPELEEILKRTLGVPLFQEQAMEIAIVAAGFTPAEADQLRRSMASFKANGKLHLYEKKMVDGMTARGYEEDFSRRVFKQLQGFEGYGFPESHAASFALLVYISSWLKCHYPDVFCTALLNSQPMGFYQPAQIVRDARDHGVQVLPADVNYSEWDNTLEQKGGKFYAVRLGFRQVKGLKEADMELLVAMRDKGYQHIDQLRAAGVPEAALEKLADADAFHSLGTDRRMALWEVSALADRPIALFDGQLSETVLESPVDLPPMTRGEHVVQDYISTGLSLKDHPIALVRPRLNQMRNVRVRDLAKMKDGDTVRLAGLITVRQRPGTAKGVLFMTLEDETGSANLVVWQKLFDQYRKEIVQSRLLMVTGKLQIANGVTHLVVHCCFNLTALLRSLTETSGDILPQTLARGDETTKPINYDGRSTPAISTEGAFHKGRNFH